MSAKFLPLHGGNLQAASEYYAIELDQWIDLSTGVNPQPYPVGELPIQVFADLPYLRDDFIESMKNYYCADANNDWSFIPVPGTQFAIQVLPRLLQSKPVLLPTLGYKEHQAYWEASGTQLSFYDSLDVDVAIKDIDDALKLDPDQHVVLVNPNNPTGIYFSQAQIQQWAHALVEGAYIVVDEAFMDIHSEHSLLCGKLFDNVIVLRSFGKFFGLAGARLGAVFSNQHVIDQVSERLGLWQINGPAQSIATKAFNDDAWHDQAKLNLKKLKQQTEALFLPLFASLNAQVLYTDTLFVSAMMPEKPALAVTEFFARRGILLRVFLLENTEALLRVGLVNSKKDILLRVTDALDEYQKHVR